MEKTTNRFSKLYATSKVYYQHVKHKTKSVLKRSAVINSGKGFHSAVAPPLAPEVAEYYDKETDMYLETYGNIIQAARPTSDVEYIGYLSKAMRLQDGMHILDAGCGVCGPAVALAKQNKVSIEAITISEVQVARAKQHISENGLNNYINVVKGDYSNLDQLYPEKSFDLVFFLETLGYANDLHQVLSGAAKVLKQGGSIYIKDFFLVPMIEEEKRGAQQKFSENIRSEYLYRVLNISTLIPILREIGLYIEFIKPIEIKEDFTKAAEFERANQTHSVYTRAIHHSFQLFEVLELKFRKVYA